MDDVQSGNHGIGLITSEFTSWYLPSYNYGKNHSIIFYESGTGIYLVISDEFNQKDDDSKINWQGHDAHLYNSKSLTTNNGTVIVEINMEQKIATFENKENETCMTLKDIPENIAIVFSFGGNEQTVSCIEQQFC